VKHIIVVIPVFCGWQKTKMIRIPTNGPPTHPGEMLMEEFLKPPPDKQKMGANIRLMMCVHHQTPRHAGPRR
jgi:hypothetical protein